MPGRDGTGPLGQGALTGKGLGHCTVGNAVKYGAGLGLGLGFGIGSRRRLRRFNTFSQSDLKTQKGLLTEQKQLLESRLKIINKQLESL